MAYIFQTTFFKVLSWMAMCDFRLRFHWSLLLRVLLNNIPALVQRMAWRRSGDKPLSEPMMVSLLTCVCVTRHQWVDDTDKQLHPPIFCVVITQLQPNMNGVQLKRLHFKLCHGWVITPRAEGWMWLLTVLWSQIVSLGEWDPGKQ